jgi:hypothetical protein
MSAEQKKMISITRSSSFYDSEVVKVVAEFGNTLRIQYLSNPS